MGLTLQKQGINDQAIDYINKAISTDATQIASFQSKLLEPVQNISNDITTPQQQMQPQQAQTQEEDDPFKATRELLKRFENEQLNQQSNNRTIEEKQQQPFPMNIPQTPVFQNSGDNSGLIDFIQKLYTENFSANVLFWTGVESKTIGNLNQFPGMKFSVWHDRIKSHEYYTEFLKDIKLRSMSVITDEKVLATQWDALILPYSDIDCPQDPILNVSYKSLYLANGFMNAPNRQILEATLQKKGCVPINDEPCVFERKDQLSKGELLFNEGKIEEAIQCFEDVLAGDPNNTDAYNNLGVISYSLGNMQSAEKFLLKTLEINPNHINALMNITDVYAASGLVNEAANYMTRAVDLEPKNPDVWACLSSFYKQIGSEEEAQAALKKSESLRND
jgi:tetratricopeptide (TPR) repeat protein